MKQVKLNLMWGKEVEARMKFYTNINKRVHMLLHQHLNLSADLRTIFRFCIVLLIVCSNLGYVSVVFSAEVSDRQLWERGVWDKIRNNDRTILIFNQDEIMDVKPLAKGTIGEIFEGIWQGKHVALKKIHIKEARKALKGQLHEIEDADLVDQVYREITNLADLPSHANIMRFYGVYKDTTGIPCIVTELCERGDLQSIVSSTKSLRSVLETTGKNKNDQNIRWAIEIVQGLHCLHGNGIIHRDLKLNNIFIRNDGVAVIADFGSAKTAYVSDDRDPGACRFTRKGMQAVTFKAPESIVDWDLSNSKTDIYSLGLLFFKLVQGGENIQSTWGWLKVVLNDKYLRENEFSDSQRSRVQKIIQKADKNGSIVHPFKILDDHNGKGDKKLKERIKEVIKESTVKRYSSVSNDNFSLFYELLDSCLMPNPTERPSLHLIAEGLCRLSNSTLSSALPNNSSVRHYPSGSMSQDGKKVTIRNLQYWRDNKDRINSAAQTILLENFNFNDVDQLMKEITKTDLSGKPMEKLENHIKKISASGADETNIMNKIKRIIEIKKFENFFKHYQGSL